MRLQMGLAAAALCAALLVGGAALAEGPPTRAEYVARLESICKPHALATQRVMKGVRAEVQAEELAIAAAKFAHVTQIFGETVREIGAVERPTADAERLAKWFSYLQRQESYLGKITAKLRAGNTVSAQRLTARFIHDGNLANDVVLPFGFNYCSFKFSRYG